MSKNFALSLADKFNLKREVRDLINNFGYDPEDALEAFNIN